MLNANYLQKTMPSRLVTLMQDLEMDLLTTVASRLATNKTGSLDFYSTKAQQIDILYKDLIDITTAYSGRIREEVVSAFAEAGIKSVSYDINILKRAGVKGQYLTEERILRLLESAIKRTTNIMNLTATRAIQSGIASYTYALDKAYLGILSGQKTFDMAYKEALRDIAKQGITIAEYTRGGVIRNYSIEASTRRNLITSVSQATMNLQEQNFMEMGGGLVETTSHAGARPTHAEWQGQVFYWGKRVPGYQDFVEVCGYGEVDGIGGINCYHSFYPYFEDLSSKSYDVDPAKKDLNIDNNELYELQQKQRQLERNIRQAKKDYAVFKSGGDEALRIQASQNLRNQNERLRQFLRDNEVLRRDRLRERVG